MRSRVRLQIAVALATPVLVSGLAAAPSAAAADPPVRVITVAGDLQSELGCPGDWQPACAASELAPVGPDHYAATFDLPAGSYQFKITVNGSWDENYGADGTLNGANIPLVIAGPARLDVA